MLSIVFYFLILNFELLLTKTYKNMENKHFSRKQRQLKYLVKQLTILLQKTDADLKLEIRKMTAKIKHLVSQLNGIVSTNRMKRILGTVALFIGVSFANTASAQYFQPPVTNPFGITPGSNIIVNIPAVGDLDGDGDLDLLAQEYNDYTSSMNFQYSENIGNTNTPQFSNSITNPYNLVGDTVPRFHNLIDLDGDGDLDILSLDTEELNDTINYNYGNVSHFRYYENIGTPTNPIFDTAVTNPFGLITDSAWAISDLVDIDNDGDFDILISSNSEYNSYTYYGYTYAYGTPPKFKFIENIGNTNTPIFTAPVNNPFGLTMPGFLSSPAFTDYDNDGDFDLFVGAQDTANYYNSIIHYFENTGTNTVPQFSAPLTNPFGLTTVNQFAILEIMDLDGDGDNDMLVGEYGGNLLYFENDTTSPPPPVVSWNCVAPGNCQDPGNGNGTYTSLSVCQIACVMPISWDCINYNCTDPGNGNGTYTSLSDCQVACVVPISWDCDPTLGCIDPGTGAGTYTTLSDCQVNCNSTSVNNEDIKNLKLYPNPVNNALHISTDKQINQIEIYDAVGRMVVSEKNPTNTINVEQLESGIYSIAILFEDDRIVKRFTK